MRKNTPEEAAAAKERNRVRCSSPEFKAKAAAYRATPEYRASRAIYFAARRADPEVIAREAAYRATPEYKAAQAVRLAKYRASPKGKAAAAAYHAAYSSTPEYKTARSTRRVAHYTTPLGSLIARLRARTGEAFRAKGFKKDSKTSTLLGCEWEFLKSHIESQFKDSMSWENRRLWHIDHRVPLASAKDEHALIKLCHYTNLQPLWWRDNLSKGAKILPP